MNKIDGERLDYKKSFFVVFGTLLFKSLIKSHIIKSVNRKNNHILTFYFGI